MSARAALDATGPVFDQFLALCHSAGRDRCALAGHPETAAQRVKRLFAQARRAPIPARAPGAFSKATTSAAIQCLDGPAREPVSARPRVIGQLTKVGPLWGPVQGWWLWAPCAANWPARTPDRYTGPWNHTTGNPILLINNLHDPADKYVNAQLTERLLGNAVLLTNAGYGPCAFGPEPVHRQMESSLPRPAHHPAARDRLPARPATVRPRLRQTTDRRANSGATTLSRASCE